MGQQLSFQGMLCDPSLEMVQNFLHMSFYMLGACHRNAGFMYLGIASQAAGALGLHRADHYRHLPPDEYHMRYVLPLLLAFMTCLPLFSWS